MEVQTRSETSNPGLLFHDTFQAAMLHAISDPTVWKVSFSVESGERIRLIREDGNWVYESIFGTREY